MRKYSDKEIKLLERAAFQLAIIDTTLTDLGIPFNVEIDGKKENGTHDRFKSFVRSPRVVYQSKGLWFEVKNLFPTRNACLMRWQWFKVAAQYIWRKMMWGNP